MTKSTKVKPDEIPSRGRRVSSPIVTQALVRRTPLHARGQATFDLILDVTAQLLDEVGFEAVNTNMVAKVAGINIATLYQYFSNLQAILRELFDRQTDARTAMVTQMISGISSGTNWRAHLSEAIDEVATMRSQQPGAAALRVAMRSSPELLEHDRASTASVAAELAKVIAEQGNLDHDHAALVAQCGLEMIIGVLDSWTAGESMKDRNLIEEAKKAILAYLAIYLDVDPDKASSQSR